MDNKPSVAQFISDKRAEGMSDSDISHQLLNAGWHMDVIQKAMHGDPIRTRNLDPILHIKNQRFSRRNLIAAGVVLFILLCLTAAFA